LNLTDPDLNKFKGATDLAGVHGEVTQRWLVSRNMHNPRKVSRQEEILLKAMFDVCDYEGKGYVELDIVCALAESLRQFFFRKSEMNRNSTQLRKVSRRRRRKSADFIKAAKANMRARFSDAMNGRSSDLDIITSMAPKSPIETHDSFSPSNEHKELMQRDKLEAYKKLIAERLAAKQEAGDAFSPGGKNNNSVYFMWDKMTAENSRYRSQKHVDAMKGKERTKHQLKRFLQSPPKTPVQTTKKVEAIKELQMAEFFDQECSFHNLEAKREALKAKGYLHAEPSCSLNCEANSTFLHNQSTFSNSSRPKSAPATRNQRSVLSEHSNNGGLVKKASKDNFVVEKRNSKNASAKIKSNSKNTPAGGEGKDGEQNGQAAADPKQDRMQSVILNIDGDANNVVFSNFLVARSEREKNHFFWSKN